MLVCRTLVLQQPTPLVSNISDLLDHMPQSELAKENKRNRYQRARIKSTMMQVYSLTTARARALCTNRQITLPL